MLKIYRDYLKGKKSWMSLSSKLESLYSDITKDEIISFKSLRHVDLLEIISENMSREDVLLSLQIIREDI